MSTLRIALRLAAKDVRIEARTGEIVVSTTLFAVLVTILSSLSFYVDDAGARDVAPGVLWIAIAFAGVLAMGRAWGRERDQDVLRATMLAPIPRRAIYLGKAIGTFAFVAIVEIVLVPVVALLFHLELWPVLLPLVALLVLGTIGFVAAGTLFGAMSVRTRARDLVLSIVIFPLIAPMLLAGVVATRELFNGTPIAEIFAWMRILGAADMALVAAGLVLFEPLMAD